MAQVAMFIAFQGFRDEEYVEPKKALEAAGHRVVTVSTSKGEARGKFRATAQVDKTLEEIEPADYAALALVGGPGALEHLDNPKVHALFKKAEELGKVIGAICISPVVLAHAGLLKGKTVTCWPDGAPGHACVGRPPPRRPGGRSPSGCCWCCMPSPPSPSPIRRKASR